MKFAKISLTSNKQGFLCIGFFPRSSELDLSPASVQCSTRLQYVLLSYFNRIIQRFYLFLLNKISYIRPRSIKPIYSSNAVFQHHRICVVHDFSIPYFEKPEGSQGNSLIAIRRSSIFAHFLIYANSVNQWKRNFSVTSSFTVDGTK